MREANWGGLAAVALLYGVFLLVGYRASRRNANHSAAEMLVAGRNMPFWMATITMAATWIDGGYLLGTAEGGFHSIASAWQGGACFGLSLVLGGLFFARRMRRLQFVTLVDPFTVRFGGRWAVVLALPALLGELLWSAELLVAIGATFGVLLRIDLAPAILISAAVVTAYTVWGGMWSVGYTDTIQFALIPLGMFVAIPFALVAVGGWQNCWDTYAAAQGTAAHWSPPWHAGGYWTSGRVVGWWDLSIMLVFGGIPWNCYFQRIQACQSPVKAQWHSILAGLITMGLTLPPLILGVAAFTYDWSAADHAQLAASPSLALPLLLSRAMPYGVAILGLTAIVGAVTSSFSASILSAGSMASWNIFRGWIAPTASNRVMVLFIRLAILVLGVLAAILALKVKSVQQLWFFTSDLVFVLLFPQLLYALFDPRVNRVGSIVAFGVSLVLRLGGGEPILGVPAFIPYAELAQRFGQFEPSLWLDPVSHANLFPVRTLAAVAGLILMPVVSRLTGRWDPPRPLPGLAEIPKIDITSAARSA